MNAGSGRGGVYHPELPRAGVVRHRLFFAGFSVFAVVTTGIIGYYIIGNGRWSLVDCAYMVAITITTVGYGEILPVNEVENGRLFTIALLTSGMGVSIYFLSAMTAFIVEGDLREAIWRRRVQKKLLTLSGHQIVCGAGETGSSVIEELVAAGHAVVVVERDQEHLDRLFRRLGDRCYAVHGDATEDAVLLECGVERAAGIVATLHTDRDNLFVTVTARQINQRLRIVSRAVDERAGQKLLRAGADAIVSPNQIGGKRMAHELLRPGVVGFIDLIVRDSERSLTVEQVKLPQGTPLDGRTLAESRIRQAANVLVLSVLHGGGSKHTFNPPSDLVLRAGMTLMVLGDTDAIERLRAHVIAG
ncbi:MAG: potassium channel protein [Myxococcales bacterium]|nr:potassium channel protein [Myxococcales bacterium]